MIERQIEELFLNWATVTKNLSEERKFLFDDSNFSKPKRKIQNLLVASEHYCLEQVRFLQKWVIVLKEKDTEMLKEECQKLWEEMCLADSDLEKF